ncbi:MAG TPA: hypothetical protein VHP83_07550 [Aggregatilineaceae bacterium]|nr:hypothetical protein [Aggregatilineaceae bacterium]
MELPLLLVIIISALVFSVASLFYWRLIKVLIFVVHVAAFVAGVYVVQDYNNGGEFFKGLCAGTGIYLALLTLVLAWNRIVILEKEIIRLGGKPNTPDYMEYIYNHLFKRGKKKNEESNSILPPLPDEVK